MTCSITTDWCKTKKEACLKLARPGVVRRAVRSNRNQADLRRESHTILPRLFSQLWSLLRILRTAYHCLAPFKTLDDGHNGYETAAGPYGNPPSEWGGCRHYVGDVATS